MDNKNPTGKQLYQQLTYLEDYSRCIELASGVQHIIHTSRTADRARAFRLSTQNLSRLQDETRERQDPFMSYYQWTRFGDTDALNRLLAQENAGEVTEPFLLAQIATYYSNHPDEKVSYPKLSNIYFGVDIERELRRQKISQRLRDRLDAGMVDEVRKLVAGGVTVDDLIYYGLEYKFVGSYLAGRMSYDEMVQGLEIAIHQFAKRQMTWFRGMERKGAVINWIDAMVPLEEKIGLILRKLEE